jgi:uncharacterized protein YciI
MRWVAIFEDTPQMLEVRRANESRHLEYLGKHTDEILIAGGPRKRRVRHLWAASGFSRSRRKNARCSSLKVIRISFDPDWLIETEVDAVV